jgi:uncharacterized protein YjbI with pentapeptide repeats
MTQRRRAAATIPPLSKQLIPSNSCIDFRARGPAMTRDETVALFLECEAKRSEARAAALDGGRSKCDADTAGHEAAKLHWNSWAGAFLDRKKALEVGGLWAADASGRGGNTETSAWIEAANTDLSQCFLVARRDNWKIAEAPDRGDLIPIELDCNCINLSGFIFPWRAYFCGSGFLGRTDFDGAVFHDRAEFDGAAFHRNVKFEKSIFSGVARFASTKFRASSSFVFAAFSDFAIFEDAKFFKEVLFQCAKFSSEADFRKVHFSGYGSFQRATFASNADFGSAIFSGYADFSGASFKWCATFLDATFSGKADFEHACFQMKADFANLTFISDVSFAGAKFGPGSEADFGLSTFERTAEFSSAEFRNEAVFRAIWVKRAFSLANVRFHCVPDFIQAHFEEVPRLDHVTVEVGLRPSSWTLGPPTPRINLFQLYQSWRYHHHLRLGMPGDAGARWRALKRLAIQGHDTDRELQFFSGEIRAARFAGDWPLPWPAWKASAWLGFLRFWAGMLYELFSNFGRSLIRPFLAWALCIAIFAAHFLGQSPEMAAKRRDLHRGGVYGQAIAYSTVALDAIRQRPAPACLSEETEKSFPNKRLKVENGDGFSGLMKQVRDETSLVNEALSIAYHNAVIVLDGSGDSAHRAFGCLYGVERYGGSPVAYVPRSVAIASGIQKLLSAIFIFLFGLALRNMLKVK